MKWYSVKNFSPPGDCDLFVFCASHRCERLAIARYIYEEGSGHFYVLHYDETGSVKHKQRMDQVTNFCIPDPVEIEE